MTIGINASFARKPNTGIGQVTTNFLKKLAIFNDKEIKFILYLEEDLPKDIRLPENFKKKIFLPVYKRDDLIRKIWWEKFLLPKRVKKDQCDVLISLYQCPTVIKNIKHIMLAHDIIPKLFPEYLNNCRKKIYWKLTEKAIKSADKIIAVSKRTEKDLIQNLGISEEKIAVNYIDVDEIYKNAETGFASSADKHGQAVLKKYKLKPGYILAGGGYEARKNVESVIRAYNFLNDRFKLENPLPSLAIYGKILPKSLALATDAERLAKKLNLTKQIKLLGEVSQKDMPAIFGGASVFVYPSYYEGFGLPVLEAMNCGTPVIAGKTSSIPEVGSDGILYCDPSDIRDIAMVLRNILINKDLCETLSRRGKERARYFSWEKFTEKVLNIVREL
jgi:glycosyltransferase involved in cell wall biosynthesis